MNKRVILGLILLSLIFVMGVSGCNSPPTCNKPYILVGTGCCLDQNNNAICDKDEANTSTSAATATTTSCTSQFADTGKMDIFDSHVHMNSELGISMSQIILEMDKAGVSMANLYSGSLADTSKYPGRFILFVDTPDHPELSTWLKEGQSFFTSAETQLKTGKYYGVGETNIRYYSGDITPPPTVDISPDTPLWLQLVDLSAQYHVPISFHFVPDDPVSNVAFEKMLSHNKNATFLWAHMGFNNLPLDSATLNDYLLRYPNLYFDTAGIQNMQKPLPQPNSNWARISDQSGSSGPGQEQPNQQLQGQQGPPSQGQQGPGQGPQGQSQPIQQIPGGQQQGPGETDNQNGGRLNEEWRQFFETWNSRFLFGSDAGGGPNGLERWLNYAGDTSKDATPYAVGHWTRLLSNLDSNAARNILSSNSRVLFLKEQKPPYTYSVSSDGKCYSISVNSASSVSALTFDENTKTIKFTVADSTETTGLAVITIPAALVKGKFTASVNGQSVQIKETSSLADTIINIEYSGGIKSITLSGGQA